MAIICGDIPIQISTAYLVETGRAVLRTRARVDMGGGCIRSSNFAIRVFIVILHLFYSASKRLL